MINQNVPLQHTTFDRDRNVWFGEFPTLHRFYSAGAESPNVFQVQLKPSVESASVSIKDRLN
jgi:hypothetical protein